MKISYRNFLGDWQELTSRLVPGLLGFFSFVLVFGTGIFSDDLSALSQPPTPILEALYPEEKAATPLLHYTHQIFLEAEPLRQPWMVEGCKALYVVFTYSGLFFFFHCFFPGPWASLAAFLVLFYPSHEASTFWFIGQHTTLSLGFFTWAFYAAKTGKKVPCIILSAAGSWVSYGSTPFALAMGLWFWLKKQKKQALWLFLPNFLYIFYFLFLTEVIGVGTQRVSSDLGPGAFFRRYLLQVLSSLDATVGISFFLKTGLSMAEAGWWGLLLAGVPTALLFWPSIRETVSKELPLLEKISGDRGRMTACLLVMVLTAFGLFAVVGLYPQTAFNLGNRAGIYSCLLAVWLLFLLIKPTQPHFLGLFFFGMLCAIGMSRHWRNWDKEQADAIRQVAKMKLAGKLGQADLWFTQGMRYSRMGWFDHVEGASESWVASSYLRLGGGVTNTVLPISRHLEVGKDKIIDHKYESCYRLAGTIRIINLDTGEVRATDPKSLAKQVEKLSTDKRHWFQLLSSGWVKEAILRFMPRMEYFFR